MPFNGRGGSSPPSRTVKKAPGRGPSFVCRHAGSFQEVRSAATAIRFAVAVAVGIKPTAGGSTVGVRVPRDEETAALATVPRRPRALPPRSQPEAPFQSVRAPARILRALSPRQWFILVGAVVHTADERCAAARGHHDHRARDRPTHDPLHSAIIATTVRKTVRDLISLRASAGPPPRPQRASGGTSATHAARSIAICSPTGTNPRRSPRRAEAMLPALQRHCATRPAPIACRAATAAA